MLTVYRLATWPMLFCMDVRLFAGLSTSRILIDSTDFYYCSALYPILEQRDYYERYARFWSDPGKADFLDLGILNLVFAVRLYHRGRRYIDL